MSLGVVPKQVLSAGHHDRKALRVSPIVVECAALSPDEALARLGTKAEGLTEEEAARRLAEHGPNVLAKDLRPSRASLLFKALRNPLVILLAALSAVSFATGDPRAAVMMLLMILLSVGLELVQEARAVDAAARLKAMISVNATALRDGAPKEVPIAHLAPGDVVRLAAGDMIPGDVRLLQAKDLFVIQGALTGESFPVEKHAVADRGEGKGPVELGSVAFLGTSVASGTATALVLATGKATYLGGMAESMEERREATAFERSVRGFTRLMLLFMAVMVPLVFVINGIGKGSFSEAFFFALAVAVGLTPEMLPMIITLCLSKGALAMSERKVIVKRIHAIQNLGAMDVLCTDKTGTLTLDRIVLERYCDVLLRDDERVLSLAYTNSHFQTGLKSMLDQAVLAHEETHAHARIPDQLKVDEIPFDFERRMMSVVVRTPEGGDRIITKGAPEAVFARCASFRLGGELLPMDHPHIEELGKEHDRLESEGFRVLAIATRDLPAHGAVAHGSTAYGKADEHELVLEGYVAFLDPPKDSAAAAIRALVSHGVAVKVITGDSDLVARKVCKEVGLTVDRALLGREVDAMSEQELAAAARETVLFARVSPAHKQRIITALKASGHTVGFMGDGINDAPALHAADVGISVDSAVDIAKDSADLILLEKSLLVLDEGVIEGRKVFSNILSYARMGASSNFGNMLSVLGASLFLPFLPMRPIQILANNLLYDLGQTAIPTDQVDAEQLAAPRSWHMNELGRFMLLFGPCSSIFDFVTFALMIKVFGCGDLSTPAAAAHSQSLFQTGWFVESLLTQSLIIHVIRTRKIPFLESRPSWFLIAMGGLTVTIGLALPLSPLAPALAFIPLPAAYFGYLALILLGYALLTQAVKALMVRARWI
ncbi:MAG: magnesium-translocating P-type ATPase [Byssovorax sp.]